MTVLFIFLIVLAAIALGFFVLIQNPKGGGLSGSIGGLGNQFMGVKQTTDILEKGTWTCAIAIALLALTSSVFFKGKTTVNPEATDIIKKVNTNIPTPGQQNAMPMGQGSK